MEQYGTVRAHGPVYVMGMDIKAEIDQLKNEIASLKIDNPEQIEKVIKKVLNEYDLREKEKSDLNNAFNVAIKITDWASRVEFWINTIQRLNSPFLMHLILWLIKIGI